MLHLKKLNKLKTILLSFGILLSGSLFAQSEKTTQESTIVMTKSELNSFLSTVAEARRSQLKERENKKLKQDLAELRLKYKEQSEPQTGNDNTSNQQILRELRYLNQRIDNLSSNSSNNMPPSMNRDNSTIIMPSSPSPNPVYRQNQGNTTTFIPKRDDSNTNNIKALQDKIDSLQNLETIKKENSLSNSLNASKGKLNDLMRQMDSLSLKMQNADHSIKTDDSAEKKSYFKQQVYFDNNSEQLRANYFQSIQDLTQILIKYPDSKIMLEGWASPKGSALYNKQLSMRRAESVEKAFLNNGIDTDRILASFRGEDKSSSEQQARRVDMSVLLR